MVSECIMRSGDYLKLFFEIFCGPCKSNQVCNLSMLYFSYKVEHSDPSLVCWIKSTWVAWQAGVGCRVSSGIEEKGGDTAQRPLRFSQLHGGYMKSWENEKRVTA